MFWNGDRWVEETPRAGAATRQPQPRRLRDWMSTLVIALLGPALLFPFLTVSAAQATLTVSGLAAPGGALVATGERFPSRASVQLLWDGTVRVGAILTSSRGSFSAHVTVPTSASPGGHTLSARTETSVASRGRRASTTTSRTVASIKVVVLGPASVAPTNPPADPGAVALSLVPPLDLGTPAPTFGPPSTSPTTVPSFDPSPTPGGFLTSDPTSDPTSGPTAPPTAGPIATSTPHPTGTPVPTPKPTPKPTPNPTPNQTPSPTGGISGVYGSGIGMDSLNNTQIGGSDALSASYRFRATTSSALKSIKIYIMGPQYSGYGAGTGGTIEATVQTDDGSSKHLPSGQVLATASFHPSAVFETISWASPASLTGGQLYHVVFRNTDANPKANFASVNGIFMYQPTSPRQAAFSNTDWGQPVRSGNGAWSDLGTTVPIMELDYANGVKAGVGYMEVWIRSAETISGNAKAREAFTVSGASRAVSSFSVRLMRISGSSPLTVRLEGSDGSLIETGTIAASQIAVGTPGDHGGSGHATWETVTFSTTHTLVKGQSYNVVLSTAADTRYSIFVIRQGSAYGFSPTTYFADGHAQYTTNGSSWGAFSQDGSGALDQGDLQFYFR